MRSRGERGAALVEAAIVMPLILLLTFGAIEFGIGFSQKAGLEAIARSGARAGAAASADDNPTPADPCCPRANLKLPIEVASAVNAALGSSSLPEMNYLVVYRVLPDGSSTLSGSSDNPVCGNDCVIFVWDPSTKKFDTTGSVGIFGDWPFRASDGTLHRTLCGPNPDRIGVRLIGTFHFLTDLVGHGSITLTATSVQQLEPNAC